LLPELLAVHTPPMQRREPQQPDPVEHAPPSFRQQLSAPSLAMPLLAQTRSPQQPGPLVQAPPAFRQQLRAPSLAMPLLAQTTAPPLWLHWLVAVHCAPGARLWADAGRIRTAATSAAAIPPVKPRTTRRREAPVASARVRSSNR
jgi:hypothetical protein